MLRKPDRWDLVLLAACMLFYLLFPVMDGPVCLTAEMDGRIVCLPLEVD